MGINRIIFSFNVMIQKLPLFFRHSFRSQSQIIQDKLCLLSATAAKPLALIEQWWKEYNQVHPHSTKHYRSSSIETILTATLT